MVTGAILTLGNKDSAKAISPSDTSNVEGFLLILRANQAVAFSLAYTSLSSSLITSSFTMWLKSLQVKPVVGTKLDHSNSLISSKAALDVPGPLPLIG